ncbi:hypothetical protein PLESTM_002061800 [Pleodorina starrii]|nr:hypothetical protein PLESTM_002061800 [Pleodorina starrii]
MNLERQLQQLGFDVQPSSDGEPTLPVADATAAYVIPAQNGAQFYSTAEDMNAVSAYLASGGLVVVLDAIQGQGEALRSFVSQALGYQGNWGVCKQLSSHAEDELTLTEYAASFLGGRNWPEALELAQTTSLLTWCRHEDASANIVPLYTAHGDDMEVAVQAFGKASVKGAIVWMGYDWRDGEQEKWGQLLKKLVEDFAAGEYTPPLEGNYDLHPLHVDAVLEAASDVAEDAEEVIRRFLATGPATYPPPVSPPPPNLPPGSALQEDLVTFVFNATQILSEGFNLSAFVQALRADLARIYDVPLYYVLLTDIVLPNGTRVDIQQYNTRRRAMESALRVYSPAEIADMFGDVEVKPKQFYLTSSQPALHDSMGQAVIAQAEALETIRRAMLTGGNSEDLQVLIKIFQLIAVPFPPSPPPRPPLLPGESLPPGLPPRPPSPPPRPPPINLTAVQAALGERVS